MKIITKNEYKKMPWRNGLGVTDEIYKLNDETGEMTFRISKASVDMDSAFSIFPNYMRILSVLSGNGIRLNDKILSGEDIFHTFSGDELINAKLINGPILDFNIIWNPKIFNVEFKVIQDTKGITYSSKENELIFIFNKKGECFINQASFLDECLLFDITCTNTIRNNGTLYLISLFPK